MRRPFVTSLFALAVALLPAATGRSAEAEPVGLAAIPVQWEEGGEDGGTEHGHDLTFAWVDAANQVHTEKMERVTWYEPGGSDDTE